MLTTTPLTWAFTESHTFRPGVRTGPHPSGPTALLMVTGDLVTELRNRDDQEPAAVDYFEGIDALGAPK